MKLGTGEERDDPSGAIITLFWLLAIIGTIAKALGWI